MHKARQDRHRHARDHPRRRKVNRINRGLKRIKDVARKQVLVSLLYVHLVIRVDRDSSVEPREREEGDIGGLEASEVDGGDVICV